jgi:hypothetical protein
MNKYQFENANQSDINKKAAIFIAAFLVYLHSNLLPERRNLK